MSEASALLDCLSDFVRFLGESGVSIRAGSDLSRTFTEVKLSAWERDLRRRVDAGVITQGTFNSRMSRLRVSLLRLGGSIEHGRFLMQEGHTRRAALTPPMPDHDFLRWLQVADAQPDGIRLQFLVLLLACRGAGLSSEDLRTCRGNDVVRRMDGTTVIEVHGRCARTAIVLDRFADLLLTAAEGFGDALVIGTWSRRMNPTSDLVDAVRGGDELARPRPRALRRAYVVELMHTDVSPVVLKLQLGRESLSELEGAMPLVDPSGLDAGPLRRGMTGWPGG